MMDYIRDPEEIYATVVRDDRTADADLQALPAAIRPVATRVVHACGMTGLLGDLRFSDDVAEAVRQAPGCRGAPILCDVEMVRARHHASICLPERLRSALLDRSDADVAAHAKTEPAMTRAAAQIDLWGERLDGRRSSPSAMRRRRCSGCSS